MLPQLEMLNLTHEKVAAYGVMLETETPLSGPSMKFCGLHSVLSVKMVTTL
jgi:hypothetical protein